MKLFDSHAHYYDERFSEETEGGADAILSALFSENVGWIVNVGTSNENAAECINQAAKYKNMYAAVGIHPEDAQNMCKKTPDEEIFDCVESLIADEQTRKENKIVAVGEIGFDYYWQPVDKPL